MKKQCQSNWLRNARRIITKSLIIFLNQDKQIIQFWFFWSSEKTNKKTLKNKILAKPCNSRVFLPWHQPVILTIHKISTWIIISIKKMLRLFLLCTIMISRNIQLLKIRIRIPIQCKEYHIKVKRNNRLMKVVCRKGKNLNSHTSKEKVQRVLHNFIISRWFLTKTTVIT